MTNDQTISQYLLDAETHYALAADACRKARLQLTGGTDTPPVTRKGKGKLPQVEIARRIAKMRKAMYRKQ